jgi:hypothetical protein
MRCVTIYTLFLVGIVIGPLPASAGDAGTWVRVLEDENRIKIETEQLEAAIPKNKKASKQWMTGIEKQSFLDKATGFREIGDGLMVIDWIMEPGSDAAYRDQLHATEENGLGSYLWHTNETDPGRIAHAVNAHGTSHRKRPIEGPQLCPWMKPVQPEVIRAPDFVAVKTTYIYEYAAPGRKAGSRWTQLVVFPKGKRYFVLMDKIDSVNDSDEMFLRNDTPGCVRHNQGDTFSEMYLSYLGPNGVRIPASEFFAPFPPDLKFGYRRDTHRTPPTFIRAYHLRDPKTGKDGPWLAGLTLEPSVVYEAWASQRLGNNIIVMIEEIHGRPVKAGESFSAAHIVGFFDSIDEMHAVYEKHKGHTALSVDASGWRLMK